LTSDGDDTTWSTFQAGTPATSSYATIQGDGGANYTVNLKGNVNVSYAKFYNLSSAGLTLDNEGGATATTFDHVEFWDGAAAAGSAYLNVLQPTWNGHEFAYVSFKNGTRKTVYIDVAGEPLNQVLMSNYDDVSPALSGDGSDMDSDPAPGGSGGVGHVRWLPTAAEGLAAEAERVPRGVLVTWRSPVERGTAGYVVLRRSAAAGKDGAGKWEKLAEVPAAAFGGEPAGNEYHWLDESAAKAGGGCEYRVEEIEVGGEEPRTAAAVSRDRDRDHIRSATTK
jgi:hypothetical protein